MPAAGQIATSMGWECDGFMLCGAAILPAAGAVAYKHPQAHTHHALHHGPHAESKCKAPASMQGLHMGDPCHSLSCSCSCLLEPWLPAARASRSVGYQADGCWGFAVSASVAFTAPHRAAIRPADSIVACVQQAMQGMQCTCSLKQVQLVELKGCHASLRSVCLQWRAGRWAEAQMKPPVHTCCSLEDRTRDGCAGLSVLS